jgi:hypothetical protein
MTIGKTIIAMVIALLAVSSARADAVPNLRVRRIHTYVTSVLNILSVLILTIAFSSSCPVVVVGPTTTAKERTTRTDLLLVLSIHVPVQFVL